MQLVENTKSTGVLKLNITCFSKIYLFLWKGLERERGLAFHRFAPQLISMPSWYNLKPGIRHVLWVSHMAVDAQGLGPSAAAFSGTLAEVCMGSGATRTSNSSHKGWWCQRQQFFLVCRNARHFLLLQICTECLKFENNTHKI